MGMTYAEAISQSTVEAMRRDPSIILLGSGVTDWKGTFHTTKAAADEFPSRCFDVPNSEAALGGIVCGLAAQGKRPLWVHNRIDFLLYATDPICNLLAKWAAMYQAEPLPVVIRAIVGRGWGQGGTHSQWLAPSFAHFPGLRVATPYDAASAGLWVGTALADRVPTLIVEHRALYDDAAPYNSCLAVKPRCTIVGTSVTARHAHQAAFALERYGVEVDTISLSALQPLGNDLIDYSLRRTGRIVIADPGWAGYGFSAEIAALAAESGLLQAPAVRIAPPAVPAPVSAPLEAAYWPDSTDIVRAVLHLLDIPEQGAVDPPGGTPPEGAFAGPY